MRKVIFASAVLYLVTIAIILVIKELSQAYYGPDLTMVCNYLMFAATVLLYILYRLTPEFKVNCLRLSVAGAFAQYLTVYVTSGNPAYGNSLTMVTIFFIILIAVVLTRPKPKEVDDEHIGC